MICLFDFISLFFCFPLAAWIITHLWCVEGQFGMVLVCMVWLLCLLCLFCKLRRRAAMAPQFSLTNAVHLRSMEGNCIRTIKHYSELQCHAVIRIEFPGYLICHFCCFYIYCNQKPVFFRAICELNSAFLAVSELSSSLPLYSYSFSLLECEKGKIMTNLGNYIMVNHWTEACKQRST